MTPANECPQFTDCSSPLCPLDPQVESRDSLPGEPGCKAHRTTRERIAAGYQAGLLPWAGLLPRERARDARRAAFAALPSDHPRKIALRAGQERFTAMAQEKSRVGASGSQVPRTEALLAAADRIAKLHE